MPVNEKGQDTRKARVTRKSCILRWNLFRVFTYLGLGLIEKDIPPLELLQPKLPFQLGPFDP